MINNELSKLPPLSPSEIYVRSIRVTRPLALWTMFPTQYESLVAISRMGLRFDRQGNPIPRDPLAPHEPDPVYKSYNDPHVFKWYGNNAESARPFIISLCNLLAIQKPPMYGWRNAYDQDEIMICPDAIQ